MVNSVINKAQGTDERARAPRGEDAEPVLSAPRHPDEIARQTAAAMFAGDRASQMLGMELGAVSVGRAVVTMTVRADMLNGFGICHGALVAAVADSAFAFACNSEGELTVGSGITVDWLLPAKAGDVLTATAVEVSRTTRTGLYDVTVTNQDGVLVMTLRGRSYTMKGKPSVPRVGE
jgi:acyl-CoA thioesterase